MTTRLPGQYTGWHHYCFPSDKYVCGGVADDCANTPGNRATNYYLCKPCVQREWFISKIASLTADDVCRAEAQRRISALEPIKIHTEMRKVHAEFRRRGGVVRSLGPRSIPAVVWSNSGRVVRSATYPASVRNDRVSTE